MNNNTVIEPILLLKTSVEYQEYMLKTGAKLCVTSWRAFCRDCEIAEKYVDFPYFYSIVSGIIRNAHFYYNNNNK